MSISSSALQPFLVAASVARRVPRSGRSLMAVMSILLLPVLLFASVQSRGAEAGWKIVFDRAEFVLIDEDRPPDDSAPWQRVSLPHEWRHTHPGSTGRGWYRITFELPQVPATMHAVLISNERSQESSFFVNGKSFGGARELIAGARVGLGLGSPLYLAVPPALLRAGENVIHVRMRTPPIPSISRVWAP